ncbi:putative ribonuclease H protein [Vitis vinifera]|uniref:Putative ribonuclease H protein n=1 Tax=Vitis vinifera TaxID=29760 RepID=A0A438C8H2_VITVI|nr:putative ribonuclease H protein [Vitis vinifera]
MAKNAFVEGRQILDVALIANEAIDSLLKGDEAGVLCKLDLEKAYDHINWDFLLTVMQKMGFGGKWAGWIRWCISTASFSVLINGSPAGFFQSTRGLRQGDPISPYLFVLGMETLSYLINKAVRGGFLTGCRLRDRGGSGIQVSHLFINLNKSEILSVGRGENVEVLASELGCKVGSLPSTYLGLPLGAPHKSVVVWDGVEERMRKRLALWKRQFISKGGRITLIRSTLVSMPIYLMSLLRMPKVVRLRLEKIQRDFLWGGGALEKRPHLVKWDVVCSHKKKAVWGLEIFLFSIGPYCVNGVGGLRLKESPFGSLLSVGSMGKKVEGGFLVRPFNDWELEAVVSLLSFLQGKRLFVRMEDRVLWNASKNGFFSVKSLYNTLDSSGAVPFPWRIIWSPCVPTKVGFFCLGSFLGEGSNPRSTQNEGLDFSKQVLLVL